MVLVSRSTLSFGVPEATALIAIRRDAGEETGVGELLTAIRENVRRDRKAGFITAEETEKMLDQFDTFMSPYGVNVH